MIVSIYWYIYNEVFNLIEQNQGSTHWDKGDQDMSLIKPKQHNVIITSL